jgi:hypothetical protein
MGKKGGGKKGKKDAEPTEPPHDPGWERVRCRRPTLTRLHASARHKYFWGMAMARAAAVQHPTVQRPCGWVAVAGSLLQTAKPSVAPVCRSGQPHAQRG